MINFDEVFKNQILQISTGKVGELLGVLGK